jgi:hypothetical protein
MPNFNKLFIVDCDASSVGFGTVLHLGTGPLVYFSRSFVSRHLKLVTYERELIELVQPSGVPLTPIPLGPSLFGVQ